MRHEQKTPAYALFHDRYRCRIPASYAYEAQQSLIGSPVYESEDQEMQAASEMVLQRLTIASMAQYYYRGAPIQLENPRDSVEIYRKIREYLVHTYTKVSERVNVGKVPVSDIEKLDQFATVLYRITRKYEKVDSRQSKMNTQLEELFGSRFKRRKAYLEGEQNEDEQPHPEPEHESFSGLITQSMLERSLPPGRR